MHEKRIPPAIRATAREVGADDILITNHSHNEKVSYGLKFEDDPSVSCLDLPGDVRISQVLEGTYVWTNAVDPVEVSAL